MFSGFFLLRLFCTLFARSSYWEERGGWGNFEPFEMMYNSHRGWWFIKVQCGGKWNVVGYYRLGVHRVLPTDGIPPLTWPGPHWNTTNHTHKGKLLFRWKYYSYECSKLLYLSIVLLLIGNLTFVLTQPKAFIRLCLNLWLCLSVSLSLCFLCICLWISCIYLRVLGEECVWCVPARPLDIGQSLQRLF